jgi:putative ABC transport system ATP-binding protein
MKQALDLGNRLTMLHRGNIVYDVNGRKKQALTIDDLLESFSERDIEDDELLLSIE